jgi:hypothetical protein
MDIPELICLINGATKDSPVWASPNQLRPVTPAIFLPAAQVIRAPALRQQPSLRTPSWASGRRQAVQIIGGHDNRYEALIKLMYVPRQIAIDDT